MDNTPLEKEVKFYITDLVALKNRLISLGANLVQPRTHEVNYRFDDAQASLAAQGMALRLRQDAVARLTLKGASAEVEGVRVRPEYEIEVDNLLTAQSILQELGYEVVVSYEKWRTTYTLKGLLITLDELPYGKFCEIEGDDTSLIRSTAAMLALAWDKRIDASYLSLFENLKRKMKVNMQNLTFAAFSAVSVSSSDLGVKPADSPQFL